MGYAISLIAAAAPPAAPDLRPAAGAPAGGRRGELGRAPRPTPAPSLPDDAPDAADRPLPRAAALALLLTVPLATLFALRTSCCCSRLTFTAAWLGPWTLTSRAGSCGVVAPHHVIASPPQPRAQSSTASRSIYAHGRRSPRSAARWSPASSAGRGRAGRTWAGARRRPLVAATLAVTCWRWLRRGSAGRRAGASSSARPGGASPRTPPSSSPARAWCWRSALVSIAILTRYLGPDDYGKLHARADVHAAVRRAGRRRACSRPSCATSASDPARTEELVGNALALRLLLAVGGDRARRAVSLLLPYDHDVRAGDPARRRPAAVRDAEHLARGGPPVAAADGARGGRRRRRAGGRARRSCWWSPCSTSGSTPCWPPPRRARSPRSVVTWPLTRRLVRCAPRPTGASGARCWWRRSRSASRWPSTQLYFRADTLIISLYEPYDQVGLYTLAYRIARAHAGGRARSSSTTLLPGPVARRSARRRAARPARDPAVHRAARGPGRAARGRRAGARAGRSSSWPAASDFAGRRRRRCGSCSRPARSPGSTASSATR